MDAELGSLDDKSVHSFTEAPGGGAQGSNEMDDDVPGLPVDDPAADSVSGISTDGDGDSDDSSVDGALADLVAAMPKYPLFPPQYLDDAPSLEVPGSPVPPSFADVVGPSLCAKSPWAIGAMSTGVPCEVAMEIAQYAGVRERGALACVSRAFYWGTAPSLYRTLSIDCPAVIPSSKKYPMHHVLTCLLRPLSNGQGRDRTRENLETIKVLSYTSMNGRLDFVAFPLLADVLRFCTSLRELRIHTTPHTSNVLMDTLRHHGIITSAPSSLFHLVAREMGGSTLAMPKLRSLHVSHSQVGVALSVKRCIETLVIERPLADEDLPLLLPVSTLGPGSRVTRLSLCVLGGNEALEVVLLAVARGFSALEHLAVRTLALNVLRLVEVCIRFAPVVTSN